MEGCAFTDGQSTSDAGTGPVMLKLELQANYHGTGTTVAVTATPADGRPAQVLTTTIPPGSVVGDLFPLNWAPHPDYPRGFYIDVTNAEETVSGGYLSATIVNDGPDMHSAAGTKVEHQKATLWASDVVLSTRDPDLAVDHPGRLHIAYIRDGWVIHRMQQANGVWHDEANVTLSAGLYRAHTDPSVVPEGTVVSLSTQ